MRDSGSCGYANCYKCCQKHGGRRAGRACVSVDGGEAPRFALHVSCNSLPHQRRGMHTRADTTESRHCRPGPGAVNTTAQRKFGHGILWASDGKRCRWLHGGLVASSAAAARFQVELPLQLVKYTTTSPALREPVAETRRDKTLLEFCAAA